MELQRTYHAHERHLDRIHLSAFWMSLGHLARQRPAERRWLQSDAGALEPLVQHTVRAAMAGEIGGRELANIAYGAALAFAKVGRWGVQLLMVLAREA